MKKIIPIIFALILLTGTSGLQNNSSFAQTENNTQEIIHAPDRLIVKFNPGVSEQQQSSILSSQSASVIDHLPLLDVKIISVPEPALDAVKNALSKNNSVEYAEYDLAVPPTVIPNDPSYGSQWHLPMINAPGAYDITHGDSFPIVILDSGIDMDHSDLASQIIYPYNGLTRIAGPVDHQNGCGHGTPVAGSAAAIANNTNGIAGVGWDTKIIPIKITDDNATGDTKCYGWSNGVLKGVEWAVSHGAKSVNLSYGFGASGSILTAAELLQDNGGWLVISAGNSGGIVNRGDAPSVIFVSSTEQADNLSGFSSYGNYVDFAAPGSNILTTSDDNKYGGWYGTSFAAPITASVLNLIYSVDPTLTSSEAYDILKNSAVDLGDPGWDIQFGHGRVDAYAAVLAASSTESLTPDVPPVNFKVAFIGDQGLGTDSEAVLQMIANEGTEMVLHSGDLDYDQNPTAWEDMVNLYLGPTFPYFVSVGNHDIEVAGLWDGYQTKLQDRLDSIPDATCVGDLGVKASCHYKGLFFILSGVGTLSTYTENDYVSHIQTELANDDSIWSICSWHKNQQAMQIGGKGDSVGWPAYEACKDGGAIIATAHEHSYERTKTLTNTETQTVDPTWSESNDVRVAEGSTFAFVSGLGGKSIRDQSRCDPSDVPYGCNSEWANIYAQEQSADHGALFCEFNADGQEDRAYCYFKNISGNIIDSFYVTSFMGTANPTSPPNDSPVANSQLESTDENIPLVILLDSTDSNGDSLAYSIQSTPANGGLSGTGPYLIYTPDPNFGGIDSFTFKTNDGNADSNTATVTITVAGDPPGTVNSRISSSSDDAEQRISDNIVDLDSTDIEIGIDPTSNGDQIEGLRFNNLDIPQGATVTSSYIEFETDETDSEATSVTIWAQDSDNASTFSSAASDISNRPTTASSVAWNNIPAWNTVSEKHNTPDISFLVQEVVDRSGWNSGNSMAFIISGTGQRTAESWDGESANAALLHVEWSIAANNPPIAGISNYNTLEDTLLQVTAPGVLGNATDPDGDPMTAVLDTDVSNGSLTLNADGSFSYTPDANFNGADSFVYHANDGIDDSNTATVSITITLVNDEPSFTTSDQSVGENDGPISVPGFTNFNPGATDEAGQTATYSVSNDNNGLFSSQPAVSPAGELTFEPAVDTTGSAIVTISVQDNGGTGNGGDDTSPDQTFSITVNPNFPPTANAGADKIVTEGDNVVLDGSGSTDSDGTITSYLWTQDSGTAVSLDDDTIFNPSFTAPGVLGSEDLVFSLEVTDDDGATNSDTVTITVNPINEVIVEEFIVNTNGKKRWTGFVTTNVTSGGAPVENANVIGLWSDGASGSASCTTDANGLCQVSTATKQTLLTFTVQDITGVGIEYVVPDPSDSITFDKNYTPPGVNSPPVAVDDSADVQKGSSVIIDVVDNDSDDVSLDLASITISQAPANVFSLVDNGDGTLTYTHDDSDTISDSFKYTINDNEGETSNEATVFITITEPVPATLVHVESLVGLSSIKGPWNTVTVTITVHDHDDQTTPQTGVLVSGDWSGITTNSDSCTTNNGSCSVSFRIKNSGDSTFTVTGLSGTGFEHDSGDHEISVTVP